MGEGAGSLPPAFECLSLVLQEEFPTHRLVLFWTLFLVWLLTARNLRSEDGNNKIPVVEPASPVVNSLCCYAADLGSVPMAQALTFPARNDVGSCLLLARTACSEVRELTLIPSSQGQSLLAQQLCDPSGATLDWCCANFGTAQLQ